VVTPEKQQTGRPAGFGVARGLLIGRPFGVPIYVSSSWLLFLAFITVQFAPTVAHAVPGIGSARYVVAAAFGVFLGLSVLAHEIAHCVAARRFAIPIERISLSFLAGHSALAREPESPGRASAVAAAGPVTNLAIAVCSWVAFLQLPSGGIGSILTVGLTWTNALVGLYNLLPGLPLDGGQLLRALIWRISGSARSGTIGAAWAGRVIAICTALVAAALLTSLSTTAQVSALWGLLVAAMLWVSSTSVLRLQSARDRLPGISARTLSRASISVTPDVPLAEAIRRAGEAHAQAIVIVDAEGHPTGVVKDIEVAATPVTRRPWVSVGSVSRQVSGPELIETTMWGEDLLQRLQSTPAPEYVVVDPAGDAYGVLVAGDVAAALGGRRGRSRRRPGRGASGGRATGGRAPGSAR
jgi:Zn-dependent protease/CBS domain-containing protein